MNWIFGDNINTDLITPGRYNITTDQKELAKIVFIEHRPEFAKRVKKGDYIVSGGNFGCGSSRETAVSALIECKIRAIIAPSFGRIFYRNCINLGLLAVICEDKKIKEEDELRLDLKQQKLINVSQKYENSVDVPEIMIVMYKHGGIVQFINKFGISEFKKLLSGEETNNGKK